jgi:DNA-binding response OmpR family regulator
LLILTLQGKNPAKVDTNKKHIVIIEDDVTLLQLLEKLLKGEGYEVSSFETFPGIEELTEINVDCFIIDEHLPNVTGHIICILLKSKPKTEKVPVILMSAFEELKHFANISRANAYIQKPFKQQQFVQLIGKTLSGIAK